MPYARALSGVQIRGDAHTWWEQASGKYDRGNRPKIGAVMAFPPHGNMRLGHVAAVRRIIDDRNILISHANWSTIDGVRGHIEEDVRAVDVSPGNDWSAVRVWYTPNAALGGTAWPVHGFIYPVRRPDEKQVRTAVASLLDGKARPPASAPPPLGAQLARSTGNTSSTTAGFSLGKGLMAEIDARSGREIPQNGKANPSRKVKTPDSKPARHDRLALIMAKFEKANPS